MIEDQNIEGLAIDAWIDALPPDTNAGKYTLCPCGCNMTFRFAVKDGIAKHEDRFIHNWIQAHNKETVE